MTPTLRKHGNTQKLKRSKISDAAAALIHWGGMLANIVILATVASGVRFIL